MDTTFKVTFSALVVLWLVAGAPPSTAQVPRPAESVDDPSASPALGIGNEAERLIADWSAAEAVPLSSPELNAVIERLAGRSPPAGIGGQRQRCESRFIAGSAVIHGAFRFGVPTTPLRLMADGILRTERRKGHDYQAPNTISHGPAP
jgi:hypothetical protein